MKRPKKEEVLAEIEALKAIKPKVRPTNHFGDSNTEAIEAQLQVIAFDYKDRAIENRYGHKDYIRSAAFDARNWMDGEDLDVAPSESWKELIR